MWVQMLETVSGGRADGRAWPPRGHPLELPDAEGRDLINGGIAIPYTPPAPAKAADKTEDKPAPEAGPEAEAEPKAVADEDAQPPDPKDPVQAWRDFAVSQGANQQEVNGLTKAQLQSVYGGRL